MQLAGDAAQASCPCDPGRMCLLDASCAHKLGISPFLTAPHTVGRSFPRSDDSEQRTKRRRVERGGSDEEGEEEEEEELECTGEGDAGKQKRRLDWQGKVGLLLMRTSCCPCCRAVRPAICCTLHPAASISITHQSSPTHPSLNHRRGLGALLCSVRPAAPGAGLRRRHARQPVRQPGADAAGTAGRAPPRHDAEAGSHGGPAGGRAVPAKGALWEWRVGKDGAWAGCLRLRQLWKACRHSR